MNERLSILKRVMAVQTTSYNTKLMNKFIMDEVDTIRGCSVYKKHGNIYVTRGEADLYPCVVAHTDTVHDIHKQFIVQRHKDVLYAINQNYERVGIGGDDKVGVFVALEILRTTPICKVAFFRDEEVGCQGSKVADMSFFKDVSLVLQCDRQGYSDFVSNIFWVGLYPKDFSNAIAPILQDYGRVESDGGMTDVWQLAENGLGVACANMSCGYYDPHTDNEYIVISEVFETLDFVKEVVDTLGDVKWEISQDERNGHSGKKKKYYSRGWDELLDYYDGYDDGSYYDKDAPNKCSDNVYEVVGATCGECMADNQMVWDETQDSYWCHGCQDYIREENVWFDGDKEDDIDDIIGLSDVDTETAEFLELLDKYNKKNYSPDKEV